MVRPKGPDTAVSCPPIERSGKAAVIGGIADGARDVRAVRQVPDAGRHGRRRAARVSAGRQRRIAGIARFAMNGDDGASPPQVVHHRAVLGGNQVFLQGDAIGGGVARLVYIDLHGDGYARKDAGVFPARQRGIHGRSLRQYIFRTVIDHRVDCRIRGVQPRQRAMRRFGGGHVAIADAGGKFNCGQTPDFGHASLLKGCFSGSSKP
ncbi:hypothetical protein G6F65_015584 [Rhizopus arrhizus]|nr:hypothetical protein G6F65_015584 [Rhizopus arrhizus]